MSINRRQFVATAATGLVIPRVYATATAIDRELKGKTICGYQGWFNAKGDGYDLNWRHYQAKNRFKPGHCTIDLWPDVSELDADECFGTVFKHADGSTAQVYSAAHPKTIARHFQWMQAYGIYGVAIQRFANGLRNDKLRRHHDDVIKHARTAAAKTDRLWNVMYDLSGMKRGHITKTVGDDWHRLVNHEGVTKDGSYITHNGKPLVSIWGVGFSGDRQYTLNECAELIDRVSMGGANSVMLGIPYHWREQERDAMKDPKLHKVLRKADVLSPWSVGRFSDIDNVIQRGKTYLKQDKAWCDEHGIHYLPVAFPGFSWQNLKKSKGINEAIDKIPRREGKFLWAQAEAACMAGAESLYIAMFDEMDEGTAIFKCTNNPPVGESNFLTYKGLPSDHYLWLTGQIAKRLQKGSGPAIRSIPKR